MARTAFFDEIGDLPLELQVKLLRVLQEREYRPVGSLVRQKVDLRVISATHRDLAKEVARGTFRQDLFYRLNVITVRIPALRERKEDIPLLLRHFLARSGRNYSITNEALAAMLSYDWPGNVRELSNCLLRMTAMNSGPLLHTADLPSPLQNHLEMARTEERMMAAVGVNIPTARETGNFAQSHRLRAGGHAAVRDRKARDSRSARVHQRRPHHGRATARNWPDDPLPEAERVPAGRHGAQTGGNGGNFGALPKNRVTLSAQQHRDKVFTT
jgi:DNA-binding NtrC family response regulator